MKVETALLIFGVIGLNIVAWHNSIDLGVIVSVATYIILMVEASKRP
jgi:hypothetical protein